MKKSRCCSLSGLLLIYIPAVVYAGLFQTTDYPVLESVRKLSHSIAASPSGHFVLAYDCNYYPRLVTVKAGKNHYQHQLEFSSDPATTPDFYKFEKNTSVILSPDETCLVCSSPKRQEVELYTLEKCPQKRNPTVLKLITRLSLSAGSNYMQCLFSPDNQYLVVMASYPGSGDAFASVSIWSVDGLISGSSGTAPAPVRSFLLPKADFPAWRPMPPECSFSPNGKYILTSKKDAIQLWDFEKLLTQTPDTALLYSFKDVSLMGGKVMNHPVFSPDSSRLVMLNSYHLFILNLNLLAQGEKERALVIHGLRMPLYRTQEVLAFKPDSTQLIFSSRSVDHSSINLHVLDLTTAGYPFLASFCMEGSLRTCLFSPSGKHLLMEPDPHSLPEAMVWVLDYPRLIQLASGSCQGGVSALSAIRLRYSFSPHIGAHRSSCLATEETTGRDILYTTWCDFSTHRWNLEKTALSDAAVNNTATSADNATAFDTHFRLSTLASGVETFRPVKHEGVVKLKARKSTCQSVTEPIFSCDYDASPCFVHIPPSSWWAAGEHPTEPTLLSETDTGFPENPALDTSVARTSGSTTSQTTGETLSVFLSRVIEGTKLEASLSPFAAAESSTSLVHTGSDIHCKTGAQPMPFLAQPESEEKQQVSSPVCSEALSSQTLDGYYSDPEEDKPANSKPVRRSNSSTDLRPNVASLTAIPVQIPAPPDYYEMYPHAKKYTTARSWNRHRNQRQSLNPKTIRHHDRKTPLSTDAGKIPPSRQ
ncbi:WD40 repeat domain-containing protein [Spongorhabdus nitratireducens]